MFVLPLLAKAKFSVIEIFFKEIYFYYFADYMLLLL